jgi:HlyD family secretion protein
MAQVPNQNLRSLRRHAMLGIGIMAALFVGLGGWSVATNVDGAVIANGAVSTNGGSRKVQHSEGGIVREILAQDNERVEAGQVLLKLDDVSVRAELEVVMTQLRENLGTQARLAAQSVGETMLRPPAVTADWPRDPSLAVVLTDQQNLLHSQQQSIDNKLDRLKQLVEEKNSLIEGYNAQVVALESQLTVVREQLGQLSTLREKELVSAQQVNDSKRNEADLAGQIATVKASITGTQSSILELTMQSAQVTSDFRSDALAELQKVSQTVSELMQRKIEIESRLQRLEIRAPIAGTVHESRVHTLGGVIAQGDTLMKIVPDQEHLQLDMRVNPVEVSKLHVGQAAQVKLLTFDARTTPNLAGSVGTISPDVVQDAVTGAQYYTVRVDIPDSELAKLPAGAALVAGMPAESFFQTGERSVWSYLVGPIEQRFSHTFREN